jgi:hypothetical protein
MIAEIFFRPARLLFDSDIQLPNSRHGIKDESIRPLSASLVVAFAIGGSYVVRWPNLHRSLSTAANACIALPDPFTNCC